MNSYQNMNVPFNIPIPGGMNPGKMVILQGSIPPTSQRFAVNLLNQSGDIALHVCPRFKESRVVRNTVERMNWGPEESDGSMPIYPGDRFSVLILCEPFHFKIAFNDKHFASFNHRLPFRTITNLAVDGEVLIFNVDFKDQDNYGNNNLPKSSSYGFSAGTPASNYNSGGLYPTGSLYPSTDNLYPSGGNLYPSTPGSGPYPSSGGSHYPSNIPSYPTNGPSYPTQPGYGPIPHQGPYPQAPYQQSGGSNPSPQTKPGFLDQAGAALTGVLGPAILAGTMNRNSQRNGRPNFLDQAGRALAGIFGNPGDHHHNRNKVGGILGGTLGTAVAGAALTGHLNPIKAAKKQRKAQKKALKYGLPIAGVGLGAYALHKGLKKGFRRSSSSSSSSSSD